MIAIPVFIKVAICVAGSKAITRIIDDIKKKKNKKS